MNQIPSLLAAIAIATMTTGLSLAQEGGNRVNGTVVQGNTTMTFENANQSDLHMKSLKQWSAFAQEHPKIAQQLANKPTLLSDARYMGKHPALGQLFDANPGLLAEMKQDPGNFNAIQPAQDR